MAHNVPQSRDRLFNDFRLCAIHSSRKEAQKAQLILLNRFVLFVLLCGLMLLRRNEKFFL